MSVHPGNYQHKDIEFKLTWFTQKFILLYKSLFEQDLYAKIKIMLLGIKELMIENHKV